MIEVWPFHDTVTAIMVYVYVNHGLFGGLIVIPDQTTARPSKLFAL